jgi:PAS domain S-box-containing protein
MSSYPAIAQRGWLWLRQGLQSIPLTRKIWLYLKTVNVAAEDGSDLGRFSYERWRDRFLWVRLRLTIALGIIITASFFGLDLTRAIWRAEAWPTQRAMTQLVTLVCLGVCLLLSRRSWGRRHSHFIFLGFAGSLQIVPETLEALLNMPLNPSLYGRIFTFFAQAILIPVCWPLHMLSQSLVLGYDVMLRLITGDALRSSPTESRVGLLLSLFWICVVCDLSVLLYERLQRAEFRARQQLGEAYDRLGAAEARYRGIFENAIEGVFRADAQGRYTHANPALAKILGFETPKHLIASSLYLGRQLYVEPQREAEFLAEIERSDRVVGFESEVYRADGSRIWISENVRAIRDGRGRICRYEGSVEDVSDRKQAEAEIRKALETEKELNQIKSQFVSMTSHEFRTPLTTIMAAAEALEYYHDRWPDTKKITYLKRIQSAAHHMNELLDSVLLLGQADTGRLQFCPAPLPLVGFCQTLIEEMELSWPVHCPLQLHFSDHRVTPPCPLDPADAPALDERLLRHIFTNLLSNAAKYSPEGGTVEWRVERYGDRVVFQVRDQGIGIPEDDMRHLFASFFRASNVGVLPGTGLGLAIVRRSVELHGGTVEVNSQVGQGTTFTLVLPIAPTSLSP